MNAEQKQLLYDVLMAGVPPELTVEMADMVNKDLDAIEPLIDAMLKAARNGSNPTNWMLADAEFTFLPDGANCLVDVRMGPRKFSVVIARARMKSLGDTLIKESGL